MQEVSRATQLSEQLQNLGSVRLCAAHAFELCACLILASQPDQHPSEEQPRLGILGGLRQRFAVEHGALVEPTRRSPGVRASAC
jgi:hypothetical protein